MMSSNTKTKGKLKRRGREQWLEKTRKNIQRNSHNEKNNKNNKKKL